MTAAGSWAASCLRYQDNRNCSPDALDDFPRQNKHFRHRQLDRSLDTAKLVAFLVALVPKCLFFVNSKMVSGGKMNRCATAPSRAIERQQPVGTCGHPWGTELFQLRTWRPIETCNICLEENVIVIAGVDLMLDVFYSMSMNIRTCKV